MASSRGTPSSKRAKRLSRKVNGVSRNHVTSRSLSSRLADDGRTPAGTPVPMHSRVNEECMLEEEEADNESDGLDHIILAVDKTRKNKIGCCYYVAKFGTMFFLEEVVDSDNDVMDCLKQDIQPTVVLVSSQNHEIVEEDLSQQACIDLSDNDGPTPPYKVELRPPADFNHEQAMHKLSAVRSLQGTVGVRFLVPGEGEDNTTDMLPDEMDLTEERGETLHISSSINLENSISVGCAGAIVTYLQRRRTSEYLHGDVAADDAYPLLRLEMFSLKNFMLVNSDTLAALQVIQPESHPNAAKQGPGSSGAKESLSVYGLFQRFARTPQGRQRLRNLFLRPSLDIHLIEERHGSISILSKPQNQTVLDKMSKSLAKIKNLRHVMLNLHKGVEGGTISIGGIRSGVWSSLLDFCFHVIEISEVLGEVVGINKLGLYHQIHHAFDRPELQRLGKTMFDVVDLEESQQQRRTVIKRNINEDLDRVKDAYDGIDEILQQAAIETVPELNLGFGSPVPALSVLYIPQLGFHVLMPVDDATLVQAKSSHNGWQRMFTTEAFAYFKTNRMRRMDDDLGDMWGIICDIEIEISYDLAQKVLEKEDFLIKASDMCGELDTILALAHGAIEYKLTRPHIVAENIIEIRGGRHLVQELTVPSYVTNNTFMVGGSVHDPDEDLANVPDGQHMLLLTGPNYSGKSVYLKQVALIVYLAQVGSFVPADCARLGITDKIMTRITTRESVSRGQSSFMIDLQQISWALKAFTPRSLLVIDEFGKGTDSCDGAALAAGVFNYLLRQGNRAPKVLASTHFHEMFEQGLMAENLPGLGLKQMEVEIREKVDEAGASCGDSSEVSYLYNVKSGRSKLSYGAQCAAMNGVPGSVVARACQLTELAMEGEDLISACSFIPEVEMQQLEEAESVSRAFFEMDLNIVDELDADNFHLLLSALLDSHSSTEASTSNGPATATSTLRSTG